MSETVLVVDGAATNRILLKVRLAGAFYDAQTARSLDEAVEMMIRRPVSLVVVGGDTPDAGKVTICARLVAESGGHVPVLVAAAPTERLAALRAGASAVVDRPVDEAVLLARIRSMIRDTDPAAMWQMPPLPRPSLGAPPGMAEPVAAFSPAPSALAPASEIALIAINAQAAMTWRQALQGRLPHIFRVLEPERALAEAAAGRVPELYLISAGIARDGDGLQLMSELRSRPNSRDAAFGVVVPAARPDLTAITLDLGAGDVLEQDALMPERADETALRLGALIARKRDADRRRRADADTRRLALADELTGIPNRRFALARLAEMAFQNTCESVAAITFDIDHFKRINDRHGHAAGDVVIAAVAQRLQSLMPRGAFLARMGGEEFLAVLPDADIAKGHALAERLRSTVAGTPIRLPESAGSWLVSVTLSAGVSESRGDVLHEDTTGLLDRADRAMMAAKCSGRNRIGTAPFRDAA